MDEGIGDEVNTIDATEGTHFQHKESGRYYQIPNGCNMLESEEMVIPTEAGVFDAKNLNRNKTPLDAPEDPHTSPHSVDEAGLIVEELTVRNYNSSNLTIGTSNNRERIQTRPNQWHHLYQLAGGSGNESLFGNSVNRDSERAATDDVDCTSFSDFLAHKSSPHKLSNHENDENKNAGNSSAPGAIRTKILSSSGFSEFFVKKSLKGKGVISRGPARDGFGSGVRCQNMRAPGATVASSDVPPASGTRKVNPSPRGVFRDAPLSSPPPCDTSHGGANLRGWLRAREVKINKVESLYIFKQIVELVHSFHSQGVALQGLQPSSFELLSSKEVKYIGSPVQKEMINGLRNEDRSLSMNHLSGKRPVEQGGFGPFNLCSKKQKFVEVSRTPQFSSRSGLRRESISDINITCSQNSASDANEHNPIRNQSKISSPIASSMAQKQLHSVCPRLEAKWYSSPEDFSERSCTFSSNIYGLGILLFELFSSFNSEEAHAAAMSDLRHRILPPIFLSENTKEAGFCLWLLHPHPSSRPTTREILQSEVLCGLQDLCGNELSLSTEEDDVESELLLHFLESSKEHKQSHATKLVEDIKFLEADIREVEKRHISKKSLVPLPSYSHKDSLNSRGCGLFLKEPLASESPVSNTNELRLVRNMSQIESAYFSIRCKIPLHETDTATRTDTDLLRSRENWYPMQNENEEKQKHGDRLGAFFEGLCKYARYSKFEVRGILRNGDFLNSANVICSLSFDRDEDYFAAAGVSKKIKIFDFHSLFNDSVDIHYPAVEMSNESKLSCICWNSYIRNYLASTDYDGILKLWDAGTGQGFSEYKEHTKRAWSVDFSHVDPTKLATGSDDCTVKLWSVGEKNCLGSIRNIANVCCVQFSPHSAHMLAFGSADYKTYCYDLRNSKIPWCVLAGHSKAVSYVKFLDSETLVSASTDNTLKLWDLNKTSSSAVSNNACSLTLGGHTNEKNFVGLSVADGYVACGSETNEIYSYYRALPMPITSHKFGSIDPISGKEVEDSNGQFVSSVCWRGKSNMLVAANSTGCIKVIEMV